ncbi:hypothetical protein BB561_001881 [Smittium simulii]|uniref:SXP/RAL-2 family protein Ani s 5-like cation-binding domain-containing protein n=1 Tax=Smittium simulii TaxID=133385 RepID=A0A2T9YSJ9_9FUNG|nr:hypothetical protein BB561_001881 [Smittium simulii]
MQILSLVYFIAFIPSAILATPSINTEAQIEENITPAEYINTLVKNVDEYISQFEDLKREYQNLDLNEMQEFVDELNAMDEMNESNSGLEKRLISRKKGNAWTLMDTIAPMLKRSIESDPGLERRLVSHKKGNAWTLMDTIAPML